MQKFSGAAEAMALEEADRRHHAAVGGTLAGGMTGGTAGALLGKHLAGGRGAAVLGGLGTVLGAGAGHQIAKAKDSDKVVHRQQTALAREQAQADRKELLDKKELMKKSASYNSIMYAAMADELANMDKVAIGVTDVTGVVSGLMNKAKPIVSGLVDKAKPMLGGLGNFATNLGMKARQGAVGALGKFTPSAQVGGAIHNASTAMAGHDKLIGGGLLAGGVLAAGGLAHHVLKKPQPVMMQPR